MTTVESELNSYTIEYDGDGPQVSVLYPSYTGGGGGSFDGVHNDLDGRSTSGAHPSTAISGLGTAATTAATDYATAAQGTDARTPTAHAASHEDGGSDELALDASQIATGTVNAALLPSQFANSLMLGGM